MNTRQSEKPDEEPILEIIPHKNDGFFVGIRGGTGVWPFQSEVLATREEAEEKLSELNAPPSFEALCTECKPLYSERESRKLSIPASGLWACPCSGNSLLFPRSQTVEESVRKIQDFMQQSGE